MCGRPCHEELRARSLAAARRVWPLHDSTVHGLANVVINEPHRPNSVGRFPRTQCASEKKNNARCLFRRGGMSSRSAFICSGIGPSTSTLFLLFRNVWSDFAFIATPMTFCILLVVVSTLSAAETSSPFHPNNYDNALTCVRLINQASERKTTY